MAMKNDPSALRIYWQALTPAERNMLTRLFMRRAHAARARAVGAALRAAWRRLLHRHRYQRDLRDLAAMDDRALRDIGISRGDIRAALDAGEDLTSKWR
jgi:uncharacterized protein YjiS (DUF1127 family)